MFQSSKIHNYEGYYFAVCDAVFFLYKIIKVSCITATLIFRVEIRAEL
jgi:hypothetical protein